MEKIFGIGNFYFDIISIVFIVIALLAFIVGLKRGFIKQIVFNFGFIITIVAAIFLCKYVGEFVYNLGLGQTFYDSYIGGVNARSDYMTVVVTSDNRDLIIEEISKSLSVFDFLKSYVMKFISGYIPLEGGETAGHYLTVALAHLTTTAIGFGVIVVICIIIFIILGAIVKKMQEKRNAISVLDRILGAVLSVAICYLVLDLLLFSVPLIGELDSSNALNTWLAKTLYIDDSSIFTISKFMYQNSVVKYLISLVS